MEKNKLRIGMLAPNIIRIPPNPPEKYVPAGWSGAPEQIVHLITEELVKRGHEVTLFASGNSETAAHLVSIHKVSSSDDPAIGVTNQHVYYKKLIEKAYEMAAGGVFDIIHSHFDSASAPYAAQSKTPTISTLHSPLVSPLKESLAPYKKTQYYASISDNQRKGMPDLQYAITAHNGIETDLIPFSQEKDDYLIFAGRIFPIKGTAEAIEVAKRTGKKLLIYGSHQEEDPYWQTKIKPQIDGVQIIHKGFAPRQEIFSAMSRAVAFIFPLQWEEPFGLVAAEAMATGTPVITFARGSMPEIVENGVTGFICKDIDDMVATIARLSEIKPTACRDRAARLFSVEAMVDRYEEAYYAIVKETHAKYA